MRVGLTAVVSVKLDGPEYLGATRRTLGGAEVRVCVEEAVRDRLGGWLAAHPGRPGSWWAASSGAPGGGVGETAPKGRAAEGC
ncbi:hypothetical protein ACFQ60_07635 [Streptomyces zhihengii]